MAHQLHDVLFPGCVISMCSYDFIKYRPQPATQRSKVQKQGYNKEDKEILQDRQMHTQNQFAAKCYAQTDQ